MANNTNKYFEEYDKWRELFRISKMQWNQAISSRMIDDSKSIHEKEEIASKLEKIRSDGKKKEVEALEKDIHEGFQKLDKTQFENTESRNKFLEEIGSKVKHYSEIAKESAREVTRAIYRSPEKDWHVNHVSYSSKKPSLHPLPKDTQDIMAKLRYSIMAWNQVVENFVKDLSLFKINADSKKMIMDAHKKDVEAIQKKLKNIEEDVEILRTGGYRNPEEQEKLTENVKEQLTAVNNLIKETGKAIHTTVEKRALKQKEETEAKGLLFFKKGKTHETFRKQPTGLPNGTHTVKKFDKPKP